MAQRQFVIGDIHGGYLALKQVLEAGDFDYENDKLISLGDLCDGWSQTREVIEELQKIKNLVLCRGNHDEWTLQALSTLFVEELDKNGYDQKVIGIAEKWFSPHFFNFSGTGMAWYAHGGRATEKSYENDLDGVANALKFLDSAVPFYIDEEDRIFLHAGFDPNNPPHKSENWEKLPENFYYWDREFWHKAWTGRKPGKAFKEVYIGHTPTVGQRVSHKDDKTKPLNRDNVWNMDTGACFNGKLSIMNIETKELFQSEQVRKLYPDEPGRMGVSYNQEPNI